jgi:transposase
LYDELKNLKKELAQVKQERDLLKKATAYFAREIKSTAGMPGGRVTQEQLPRSTLG